MKRLFVLGVLLVAAFGVATAQESARIAQGPYLQAVGENEFTVVWTTTTDAVAWVEIAPKDGTHFYAEERPQYYQTRFGRRSIGKLHRVRVTGLQPSTTYRYRVMQQAVLLDEGKTRVLFSEGYGSDILKHKPFEVTTLDPSKSTVHFAVANDMHEHNDEFRALFRDARNDNYDFVCMNGDMVTYIDSEKALFDAYLQSASELFASDIPMYIARGNHENRGKIALSFMDYFPSLSGCPYFAFRQGPAYVIVLDSGEDKPDSDIRNMNLMRSDDFRREEADWLRGVVDSEAFRNAPVRIVLCHMPPAPKGWHGGVEVSRLFVPILNDAGVDVMLCGHTHRYSFTEAGGENGCRFPVLCNPALCRLDVKADASQIDLNIVDTQGKTVKTHRIPVRR